MDLRKLKTLIDLVSESNVSELEITEAEGKGAHRERWRGGAHDVRPGQCAGGSCSAGCGRQLLWLIQGQRRPRLPSPAT
jgi:hypothetical protein